MRVKEIPVHMECEICGTVHIEYAIDGHVSKPHLCDNCWRELLKDYERQKGETE